jgi:hypothetical protein
MMTTMAILAIVTFASACDAPASGTSASASASRAAVGPGTQPAMTQDTINNFAVCINSAPSFSQAEQQLRTMLFEQNSATGTWYHQSLNLSINVNADRCSMVFASNEKPELLSLALAVGSTQGDANNHANIRVDPDNAASTTSARGGTTFNFTPAGQANGNSYFRAVLAN